VPLRLPEPGSFEELLRPIRIEVASLVRLSRHVATEPYWSAGVYRFDDPDSGGAGACYTASTIEVAFAESVIHECGRFVGGSYEVPAAELTERSVVRFCCERRKTLVLADLTGAALKSLVSTTTSVPRPTTRRARPGHGQSMGRAHVGMGSGTCRDR
jgi:hypothetical protein